MLKLFFTKIIVLLTLAGCTVKAQNVPLPPSFKICQKQSPNLAACVKDSVEYLKPYLKTGDLGNGFKIVSLEPLIIGNIHLERGKGFYFNLNNIRAFKLTNFHIDKLRIISDNLQADLILKIPRVEAFGDYKMNMRLGILDIQGQGKFKAMTDEIKVRIKLVTSPFYINGVEYRKVTKVNVIVKIINLVLKLDNLFKDKVLSEVGEGLVNQNLPMFLPEIEKTIEDSITKIAFQASNGILERIPIHQLLP